MAKPTLTQSVMEVWDGLTGNVPKLYNEELPPDAPQTPAAYFLHNGEGTGRGKYNTASTKPSQRDGAFDIVLFSPGVVALEALALVVLQAFTPSSLALDSSQVADLWQSMYQVRGTKQRTPEGEQVYMATLSYECYLSNPAA